MELVKAKDIYKRTKNKEHGAQAGKKGNAIDHEHGGNIYKIAKELGVSANKVIDFSASINPLGVSKKVKNAITGELDNLINYPDPENSELRQKIAEHHDIDPAAIICGNGSTELIYLIPRALKPEKVLIPFPTFSEYERACILGDESRVKSYKLRKEDKFDVRIAEYIKAMQGCDMAFLCNPNNPTGNLLSKKQVLEIAEAAKKEGCMLVVDEAFIDFTPEESVVHDVEQNPYLIVLRSMTKFYALTGLRTGCAVINTSLIERIKVFKEPWTVNNLAQKAAVMALEDNSYADKTYRLMGREKEFLERRFEKMGIEFFPSAANYYLLKVNDGSRLVLKLREKGILVRDCSNFNGLDNSYIRVAVKSQENNKVMIKEIKELCRV